MPKATLSFSLPEDQVEFDQACKAGNVFAAIGIFNEELRSHLKHNKNPEWHTETVESIKTKLYETLEGLNCI